MSHGDQIDCIFFTDFRDQVWQVCSTLQHQVYRKSHVLHFWIQCVFNERFQINGTGLDWNIYFFKDYSMIFMRNTIALAHESWAWFFLGHNRPNIYAWKRFVCQYVYVFGIDCLWREFSCAQFSFECLCPGQWYCLARWLKFYAALLYRARVQIEARFDYSTTPLSQLILLL